MIKVRGSVAETWPLPLKLRRRPFCEHDRNAQALPLTTGFMTRSPRKIVLPFSRAIFIRAWGLFEGGENSNFMLMNVFTEGEVAFLRGQKLELFH